MKQAELLLTKLHMSFTNDSGQPVDFDFVEVEFAPNLYVKLNLTPNNLRVLQRYNPDFYQLIMNVPLGSTLSFKEYHSKNIDGVLPTGSITGIYNNAESEL